MNKVSYIKQFENIEVSTISISDLHANFFDLLYLKQLRPKPLTYALSSALWLMSKVSVFGRYAKKSTRDKVHLLVPSEPEKVRSMGMFRPVFKTFYKDEVKIQPLRDLFSRISLGLFMKWLVQLPFIVYNSYKALKKAIEVDNRIKMFRVQFLVDSVIHYFIIDHLVHRLNGFKSLLVDWDRHKFASLVVVAANLNRTKTYTFVHGAIYTPEKFVPLVANFCLAWSETQKGYLGSLGVDAQSIIVTGNPRFNNHLPDAKSFKSSLGLERSKVILYASQNFPDFESESLIELILEGLKQWPEWRLVVRPHPAERNEDIAKYTNRFKEAVVLDEDVEADVSLALCDFVILVSSTFSIDSLIKRKSVLLFNPWKKSKGIASNLIEQGAVHIETLEQFNLIMGKICNEKQEVSCVLNQNGLQKFLDSYCTYTSDTAASKVHEALINPTFALS